MLTLLLGKQLCICIARSLDILHHETRVDHERLTVFFFSKLEGCERIRICAFVLFYILSYTAHAIYSRHINNPVSYVHSASPSINGHDRNQ
jgi:hypothetical protein